MNMVKGFFGSIKEFFFPSNPLRKRTGWTWWQFLAVMVTFLMMAADFYALYSMFAVDLRRDEMDSAVYALVIASALEGFPFVGGMLASEKIDQGRYIRHDAKVVKRGFWFCFFGFLFAYLLTLLLRVMVIRGMYRFGELDGKKGWEELLPQVLLLFSPFATSFFSFAFSWFAFRSRYMYDLFKTVADKQETYLKCKQQFQDAYDTYQRARTSLWTSLVDGPGTDMPSDSDRYRQECFARIRSKLVANCITCYPTQIERYTQMVNLELERCILEIAKHTTLPQSITSVPLAQVIHNHDAEAMDYADCWNYNFAGPDLEAELRSTLDNAVVVAQYETVIHQNRK